MSIITTPHNYWISRSALSITLNALGEPNRIQCSVASGAAIVCYVKGIKPASESTGDDDYSQNGDGLEYDNGHNYRSWPLAVSRTYFNSNEEKYVYVAIPRSASVGTQAQVVFPGEQIDIYGKAVRTATDAETGEPATDEDGNPVTSEVQIGSSDYFYIFLQGIITSSGDNGTTPRGWAEGHRIDTGTLSTDEALDSREDEWYRYSTADQTVTFLKEIAMADGSKFLNLIADIIRLKGQDLTGVATGDNASGIPEGSKTHVVTPSYLDEFGNTRYLSKVHDDTAAGLITFLQGLKVGSTDSRYGIDGSGIANFLDVVFDRYLKSKDARSGFTDGKGIWMDALQGLIQTDGLEVRGFMRVMELIINRLQLMESDYSFTEGDTVEHIDYEDNGQTLVLTMHKDHDNDYTPFYPGDIIYGIRNDLLPRDGQVPDGHTVTRNGSYYKTWMRVKSVDFAKNQLRVALYEGRLANGTAIVPGGTNFSPGGPGFTGTPITTDAVTAMLAEYEARGGEGYDDMLTVTRHGNVADGINPDTGLPDEHILESQLGRQQAWVLSTTDKRLSFFWNVDAPIIRDENYALCLGILPDLANLPSTRNKEMPSLYVNTVFYDHQHRANWPHKVVKEDRGQWNTSPTAIYTSEYVGTYIPDGTLPEGLPYGIGITVATGQEIAEPYHFRTIRRTDFLHYRLSGLHSNLSDAKLLQKMMDEWREEVDLEVSRVWRNGIVWECLVDGTTQEPSWGCTDWQSIGGDTIFYCEILSSAGSSFRNGNVDTILTMSVRFGQEDISQKIAYPQKTVTWKRMTGWDDTEKTFVETSADRSWTPTYTDSGRLAVVLLRSDMGSGWMTDYRRAQFVCIVDEDGPEPLMAARRIL